MPLIPAISGYQRQFKGDLAAVGGNFAARLVFEQVQKVEQVSNLPLPRCPDIEPSMDGLRGCVEVPIVGYIDKIRLVDLTLTGLRNSSAPRCAYSDSNAMLFNVSGLLTGSVGDELRFHFANETLESDGLLFHEVEARGKLMRTDRTVFADVKVEARFDVECSRCLVDTVMPLSLNFAEEFRPLNADLMASHRGWFEEYGTDENDEALIIDSANVLDISTALWQGLSAALPMNPLCDPACKGMCSSCSADLNVGICKCQSG